MMNFALSKVKCSHSSNHFALYYFPMILAGILSYFHPKKKNISSTFMKGLFNYKTVCALGKYQLQVPLSLRV